MKKTPIKPTSKKRRGLNKTWRDTVIARAGQLQDKYDDDIICEYSKEVVLTLASVPNTPDDAWGHHIDGDRLNNTIENCYIVKYKYHDYITKNRVMVAREDFGTRNMGYL